MSSDHKASPISGPQHPDASAQLRSYRRRRLIQGGIAATPVVAVLKSRQVLASTSGSLQCRSVSAYVSGSSHLSHHPEEEPCYGRTPGYWKTHPEEWLSPYEPGTCKDADVSTCKDWNDDGTKLTDVWPLALFPYKDSPQPTMMQVFWWAGGQDRYQQGSHLVAAVLNNVSGKVSEAILPRARIIAMGNAVLANQPYVDLALGISWNGEQVVAYLQQTMTM